MVRLIRKGTEPPLLIAYRKSPGARYDSLPADAKDQIRAALVRDQHGLCCYCMQRIENSADRVKIEHWMPQSVDASRALEWRNLLGACTGNEGSRPDAQHCDTRKGNTVIVIDPQEAGHIGPLSYATDGAVRSPERLRQADIDGALNLNHKTLCRRRINAIEGMAAALKRKNVGEFSQGELSKALERARTPSEGFLDPFTGALEWWLIKRMGRS